MTSKRLSIFPCFASATMMASPLQKSYVTESMYIVREKEFTIVFLYDCFSFFLSILVLLLNIMSRRSPKIQAKSTFFNRQHGFLIRNCKIFIDS